MSPITRPSASMASSISPRIIRAPRRILARSVALVGTPAGNTSGPNARAASTHRSSSSSRKGRSVTRRPVSGSMHEVWLARCPLTTDPRISLAPRASSRSWSEDGPELFRSIDPARFELTRQNPVRLLREAPPPALARAARDSSFVRRAEALERALDDQLRRRPDDARPVAFMCLEYGVHPSLPIYSGGLGVLAGDFLKESSDRALPMVGVGLLYSQGSYHQRLDPDGWQHDYWVETDPEFLPLALVTGDDGEALTVVVPVRGRDVVAQIWRVDVGRVPLYLLDTRRPENDVIDRWITSRLYVSDPKIRLAQYAALGVGGIRALRAVGIDPGQLHLNEGHPALAPIELAAEEVSG